jgi:hypothetical protein
VPNNLQAEFGKAPASEESKKVSCSTAAFPKLFTFREVARAGFSCYNVTPLPRELLLHLDVKDWLKEDEKFFDGGWIDWWAVCKNNATGGLNHARD